jgi:tetratricopeptide (TPR) repeat protein
MITDTQQAEEAVTMEAVAEPYDDPVQRAQALRGAREFAEAEAVILPLMVDAAEASESVLVEYAFIANDQNDWPIAAQRWRRVLERFPEHLLARSALVNALTASRRFDEAETEAAELLKRHPDEVRARWAVAWCAHERAVWDLAASRWQAVLDADPDDVPAVCCHITALISDGRDKEADAAAESALQRFGENAQVAEACAWIPHKRRNWPLAVVGWRRLTVLDPNHAAGFACLATALRALGRHDTAERALLRAIALAPDQVAYQTDYARAAEERGDAAEAQRRWQSLRERNADDPTVLGDIGHHQLRANLSNLETAQSAPSTVASGTDARSLLLPMEGLGDNCEFGMLQRRFGAEPLGLLRFASISLPNLIAGLYAGFEGVGDLAEMRIEVLYNGEYLIQDAYGIKQHTFVYRHELSEDRFAAQTARRSVFLRNKLLDDLKLGAKLFVCRINAITAAEATALHTAMRTYGRPHLLCVQKSDANHAAGSVETLGEGLMLGYVSRFASQMGLQDCEYGEWLTVCRAAHAIRARWQTASLSG